jgi:hypothetical protein
MKKNIKYFFYLFFLWIITSSLKEITPIIYNFNFIFSLSACYFLIKEIKTTSKESKLVFSSLIYFLISLFLILVFINIFRSPPGNVKGVIRFLGFQYGLAGWIPILFIFIGSRKKHWSSLLFYSIKYAKISIALILTLLITFLFNVNFQATHLITISCLFPILFLNSDKFNKKTTKVIYISMILFLLSSYIIGSRTHVLHMLSFFFIYFLYIDKKDIKHKIKIYLSALALLILMFLAWNEALNINENSSKFNVNLENTRSQYVYPDFISDFNSYKKIEFELNSDWIFGRGINGSYYSKIFELKDEYNIDLKNSLERKPGYRTEVECGYLFYILKIGLLGLIIKLVLAVLAIFHGFRSKNKFTKTCAVIVLQFLFLMIPGGLPEFSTSNILLWSCVGACLSKETRFANSENDFMIYLNAIKNKHNSYINPHKF